jgi:hypothetical protein
MIARLLLALLLLVGAPGAWADERPPRYDLDGLCSRRSDTPDGFSPETMAHCLSAQEDALEAVRRAWNGAPDYIQRDCDLRAKIEREGDYQILDNCVRKQLRQQQADQAESTRPKQKKAKAKTKADPDANEPSD